MHKINMLSNFRETIVTSASIEEDRVRKKLSMVSSMPSSVMKATNVAVDLSYFLQFKHASLDLLTRLSSSLAP